MLIFSVNATICKANDDIIRRQSNENDKSEIVMEEGKTYYLEISGASNGVLLLKQVDKMVSPHITIIASYEYNIFYGTTFKIINPLAQKLSFRGYVKKFAASGYRRFDRIDLVDKVYSKKWQGIQVHGIMISNFELVK